MRKLIKTYPDIFFNMTRKAEGRWYLNVKGDERIYETFFRNLALFNLGQLHYEMLTK